MAKGPREGCEQLAKRFREDEVLALVVSRWTSRPRHAGRLVLLSAVAGCLLTLSFPARSPAVIDGPAPGLCTMDTSRGSVPPDFAVAACVNRTSVWLRNTLQVPVLIQLAGDTGIP